jgi:hypothetical protein
MIAVVVPTCRGFTIPRQTVPVKWYIVHDEIQRDLVYNLGPEDDFAIIHVVAPDPEMYGRKCDSIRSAGFLQAMQDGAKYVLTVDDDCFIPPDWAQQHVQHLKSRTSLWSHTVHRWRTRGMPYSDADVPVAVTHGLWDGVLDLDARTQKDLIVTHQFRHDGRWAPIAPPFAQSAMNFGFRAEVGVCMYQPAQGPDTPFDRFADIWGGLFAQRVLSLHDYAFLNGGAIVYHQRASNVEVNLVKEGPGIECHESFWRHVWAFSNKKATLTGTYMALANHVEDFRTTEKEWKNYFGQIARNMRTWATLLESASSSPSTSPAHSSIG